MIDLVAFKFSIPDQNTRTSDQITANCFLKKFYIMKFLRIFVENKSSFKRTIVPSNNCTMKKQLLLILVAFIPTLTPCFQHSSAMHFLVPALPAVLEQTQQCRNKKLNKKVNTKIPIFDCSALRHRQIYRNKSEHKVNIHSGSCTASSAGTKSSSSL